MFRFNGFTQKANSAINLSISQASAFGHTYIGSEHLLAGLLKEGSGIAFHALTQRNIAFQPYKELLIKTVGKGAQSSLTPEDFTPRCKRILENSMAEARTQGGSAVGTEHILIALLKEQDSYAIRFLRELGVDCEQLMATLMMVVGSETAAPDAVPGSARRAAASSKPARTATRTNLLERYGRDLTEQARMARLDPVIGRDKEISRVIQILTRRTKNNPCIIGEAGVGKTAVAEGLARRIAAGEVPDLLKNSRLVSLDLSGMVAGTKYRGDFEERIKNIVDEVISAGNIILFIDEIHNLIGTGAAEGAIDAANILKPQLARGEMQVLGATTVEEYRKYIEKDAALERRFQSVLIEEPTEETTLEILKGLRSRYEDHHRLSISDEALEQAVNLSVRYLPERYLPDKAIDLIDEAASRLRMTVHSAPGDLRLLEEQIRLLQEEKEAAINGQDFELAAKLRDSEQTVRMQLAESRTVWQKQSHSNEVCVTGEDIAALIAQMTGVDISAITEEQSERLLRLEELLHRDVIGQQEAVSAVSRAIRRGRVGLKDPNRPIGTFLFLGPTGVGKTQLCKALAQHLFGNEDALIRLDMSEFMEQHSVSKLIGSPPGYVGYDDGGKILEKIRRKPYSVVLFDEIEKAHPDVWGTLLQVMDNGFLTDSQGRKINFRNTVLIMTSNVGARHITDHKSLGFADGAPDHQEKTIESAIRRELKATFRPEFLNRIDETVVFTRLGISEVADIARLMLDAVAQRLKNMGVLMEYSQTAAEEIAKAGYDEQYGARPLRRCIQTMVEDHLAGKLLSGEIASGDKIFCDWQNELRFNKITI